jgi:predicted transcriptional regulator
MTNQAITTTQNYVKNRNKLDIIASILKIVNIREASKTHIMYGGYLSFAQIREYLPTLLENGMLTTTNQQQSLYKIRERGVRFLELYDGLNEMIGKDKTKNVYK